MENNRLFIGVNFKSESDTPPYGKIVITADDGHMRYAKSIWGPAHTPGWFGVLEEISRSIGDANSIKVQLYLHDWNEDDDGYTLYYDNLYVSTAPPPAKFKGGSTDLLDLTPEQEEFDRVLSQILSGEMDPSEYLYGSQTLGQYDQLLKSVLISLNVTNASL